jgi:hypothetical protein
MRTRCRRRFGAVLASAALALLVVGLPATTASAAAGPELAPAANPTATVAVNATAGLATIPATGVGMSTAVYDGYMTDAPVPTLLKAAGVGALRYPGGSYSDIFNWQTNTAAGGYDAPNTSFANFMTLASATGAQPVITANYGSGTPALAAAWVQNANVTNHYGIKYWEIGNEVYGNGYYGSQWENDTHAAKSPTAYANNWLQYDAAMKAVDPTIKVGVVLTTPGFWPDGIVGSGSTMDWNHTVLSIIGANADFVIVHYYPGGSSAANMLTDTSDIAGITSAVRSEVNQYAGGNARNVQIAVTETNSSIDLDTQPGALFAADNYTTWLENGITNVDWWNTHNGAGTPSTVNGVADYDDQGVLSNGSAADGVTEPAPETPFASYYGIQMLSRLGSPGDELVGTSSSQSLVKAHAVRRADGDLDVLLINEDPTNAYTVNLGYTGFTPTTATPTVYTFGNNATSISTAGQGSSAAQTIPPYSLTTVVLKPNGGGTGGTITPPSAPGTPVVSNLTSTGATLTWPAAVAGTNPVAGYQVYQQSGGTSTLVATTTGSTAALTGLTVGGTYTVNVVAVDSKGTASLPSSPVTFTTPPPASSSCAVSYAVSSSWPGGFGANITVTNKGSTAINGWTLTFTFPATGEAVSNGWNGTFSQAGQNVTVTNAGYNGTIPAAGGSTSVGFNGTNTGQAPAPTVLYLNGSACSAG